MFGAIDFYQHARGAGIKPILGCELYVAPGSRFERAPVDGQYEGANHVTALVRNETGYHNLIKLVSKGYLEGFYYKPRVDKELLAQHADGLLILSGCLNSEVSRLLLAGEERKALEVAGWYADVFGRDHYFMEIQAHGLADQIRVTEGTLRIARALGVGVAAPTTRTTSRRRHARAHEVLLCLQTGAKIADPNRWKFATEEFYLKSAEEMRKVFEHLPEACTNTLAVAERCNLELTFGQFRLPRYEVPAGQTLDSYLRRWPRPASTGTTRSRRRRCAPGSTTSSASSRRCSSPATSWSSGTSSGTRRSGGSRWGLGAARRPRSLVAYCLGITP